MLCDRQRLHKKTRINNRNSKDIRYTTGIRLMLSQLNIGTQHSFTNALHNIQKVCACLLASQFFSVHTMDYNLSHKRMSTWKIARISDGKTASKEKQAKQIL